MSQENVDVARRAYEAFNRGDIEGMVAELAPSFEYETTAAQRPTCQWVSLAPAA
jgi:ketosteroid isomerase-like protein